MKIKATIYSVLLSTILIFVSCAGDTDESVSTLIIVREQGPNSIDINGLGTNRPAYGLSWNIHDRLLTYGTKVLPSGEVMYDYTVLEPELAERWEVSSDGSYVDFYLRDDAMFHDGTPVTASDVKWSFDRAVSVGGFGTFQMGAGSLTDPEQFEVISDHVFRVHLLVEDKLTLPNLATPVAAVFNSTLAQEHATESDPWAMDYLHFNPAGSGAYMIETYDPGVQTVYTRNDDWVSGELPYFERVIVQIVPSASNRRALLERGDADISFDLPPRDFAELADVNGVTVSGVPVENFMWYVDMNVTIPPFDDQNVRRAIAYATPFEDIFDAATYGRAAKLYGGESYTPDSIDWPQPYPYTTDLDRAREYLSQSEYPEGFDTTLYINLGLATWTEPTALLLQENLQRIGINAEIEKIPGANWRGRMAEKSMPLLINDMGGWLNYPDYFFFWNYHSQNGVFNTMNYQNPEMDTFIDAARFAESQEDYEQNIKGFLEIAFRDTPRVPLFQSNLDVAHKPEIQGYQYWFHRQIDFRQIYRQ